MMKIINRIPEPIEVADIAEKFGLNYNMGKAVEMIQFDDLTSAIYWLEREKNRRNEMRERCDD